MRQTPAHRLIDARSRDPWDRLLVGRRLGGKLQKTSSSTMDRSSAATASLIDSARQGDEQALATLVPLVYDELRRLAASYLRRERPGQTLQATALVHDAYLRLLQDSHLSWQNRAHFFGIAGRSMRQILIERARARGAAKAWLARDLGGESSRER